MKVDMNTTPEDRVQKESPRRTRARPNRRAGRKTMAAGAACLSLAAVVLIGGMLAYQTVSKTDDNIFTIGHVEINAWEPNFPTEDDPDKGRVDGVPDECELMIPFRTISKDPRIKNTGKNDCIVFFRVTNPAEILNLVNDDGTRLKNVEEDIFFLKKGSASDDEHANSFNDGWIRLDGLDGKIIDKEGVNDEGRGREYIFGWHVRLAPGEKTATLFDKIQNKKYGSRTIRADEIEQIKVESFAIQADFVKRKGLDIPTDEELSKADLEYIYNVFINQNVDTVGRGGLD